MREVEEHRSVDRCIDAIKQRFWNNTDIILHSREIRKSINDFSILLNAHTRQEFIIAINNAIADLEMVIISSAIMKQPFVERYTEPQSPYNLTLTFVMERFLHFLKTRNGMGKVIAESRDQALNTSLASHFNHLMTNGTRYASAKDCQERIIDLEFRPKSDNINALQIADLVAYPLARHALDPVRSHPSFSVVQPKLYDGNCGKWQSYGFKIFP